MKAIFFLGLLILTTSTFAKTEPSSDSPDAALGSGGPAEPKAEPKADPAVPADPAVADAPAPAEDKPVDIMGEDVPEELKKARLVKMKALEKKYAGSKSGFAERDKAVAMAEFNAAFFKDQIKAECKKDKKKCGKMKEKIAAIDEQVEGVEKKAAAVVSRTQSELLAQMEAVAKDCIELQKEESCASLKQKKKEYKEKYGVEPATQAENEKSKKPQEKFDAKTCKWSFDLPRRIINTPAPGCGEKKSVKTCIGYVVCDQPKKDGEEGAPLKVVRMSTCGPENCGDEDAAACTKQPGYKSQGQDEFIDGGTSKVKEVLRGGAVAQ